MEAEAPNTATDIVKYNGRDYSIAREGLAGILTPHPPQVASQAVFYNPIQQFNRDLSVLAIRIFGDDLAAIRNAKHGKRLQTSGGKAKKGQKRKRDENDLQGREETTKASESCEKNDTTRDHEFSPNAKMPNGTEPSAGPVQPSAGDVSSAVITDNTSEVKDPQSVGYTETPLGPRLTQSATNGNEYKAQTENQGILRPCSFRILDALSATGLRALRYAKEIPAVTSVTANDLSSLATDSIKLNIQYNRLADKVYANTGNALSHMYKIASEISPLLPGGGRGKYEVIDLDPYGTAGPFLDAAVQAVCDSGLLCVTCTDSSIFASTGYIEKTFSQYGGTPFKGPASHEGGLRLILHAIATSAARHGIAIEPLLSLSIDFYARVFVRIRRQPVEVKFLAGKTMVVYNCDEGCGAWTTQPIARTQARENAKGETIYKYQLGHGPSASPNCEYCGFKTHVAGPMWGGPLHNSHFIQRMLDVLPSLDNTVYGTIPRMEGMLSIALQEAILSHPLPSNSTTTPSDPASDPPQTNMPIQRVDPALSDPHPFFFIPSTLAKVLHCNAPSDAALRGALMHLGYRVARSHTKPSSIRTDAPWAVIWEVMREWLRQKAPNKEGAIKKNTAGWGVMRHDRSCVALHRLREDLAHILAQADTIDEMRVGLEAALYRAGKHSNGGGEEDEAIAAPRAVGSKPACSQLEIVFDEKLGREAETKKMVRYQLNPRANWGPMTRAKGAAPAS
jgi:tRNA (guanine26-N2/guanine27-N2)-dimethyltransferase